MRRLTSLLLILLLTNVAHARFWNWTERAEHHKSVVQVQSGSAGGSGVYVEYGELRCVLTAAHVIEGGTQATITWSDGSRTKGESTTDKNRLDIGLVLTTNDNIRPLQIARSDPKVGDYVELCGFGGPKDQLRHFSAKLIGTQNRLTSDGPVTFGDSGGTWLNAAHEVIGVQSTGSGQELAKYGQWTIFSNSNSAHTRGIRALLGRAIQKFCPGGSCPPRGGGGSPPKGGIDEIYPPNEPVPPSQPDPPPMQPNPDAGCDCDPKNSCDCDLEEIQSTQDKLAEIADALRQRIDNTDENLNASKNELKIQIDALKQKLEALENKLEISDDQLEQIAQLVVESLDVSFNKEQLIQEIKSEINVDGLTEDQIEDIAWEKVKAGLWEKMQSNIELFKGPAGEPGTNIYDMQVKIREMIQDELKDRKIYWSIERK